MKNLSKDFQTAKKLLAVLLGPHISEKATNVGEKVNQYVMKVKADATKLQIKQAVEMLYNVDVIAVNVTNKKPDTIRVKNIEGKKKGYKKAYIQVKAGQRINIAESE
jgi:large subunit ribosomal protein L23